MSARKWEPKKDDRPFYSVVPKDAKKIARAVADGKIPVGCLGINIAFLGAWARDAFKDGLTEESKAWAEENGMEIFPR